MYGEQSHAEPTDMVVWRDTRHPEGRICHSGVSTASSLRRSGASTCSSLAQDQAAPLIWGPISQKFAHLLQARSGGIDQLRQVVRTQENNVVHTAVQQVTDRMPVRPQPTIDRRILNPVHQVRVLFHVICLHQDPAGQVPRQPRWVWGNPATFLCIQTSDRRHQLMTSALNSGYPFTSTAGFSKSIPITIHTNFISTPKFSACSTRILWNST